jgi:hypothetical protein
MTDVRLILSPFHEKAGRCQVFCVNFSLSWGVLISVQVRQCCSAGDAQGGGSPDLPFSSFSLALKLVITFIALLAATVKQKESDLFQGEQTTIRGALTEAPI